MGAWRAARVRQPLLRLELVRPDGTRATQHRVFCRHQGRSLAVEACCACVHCESVGGAIPSVTCSIPVAADELDDVDRAAVGALLREGAVASVDDHGAIVGVADEAGSVVSSALALHESTPVRRALRLLASAHLRAATVVDDAGLPLGVFRDVDGLRVLALARTRIA